MMSARHSTQASARSLFVLLVAVLGLFVGMDAVGQGSIRGTVTDEESGEGLIGVNIIVVGTSKGSATDLQGRYTIPSVRAGEYSCAQVPAQNCTRMHTGALTDSTSR